MHEAAFAHALHPPEAVVLYLPLRPYSLGHEIELWRQDNPLLTRELSEFQALPQELQLEWLIKAVDCCNQTAAEYAASREVEQSNPAWYQWRARRRKAWSNRVWSAWSAMIHDGSNLTDKIAIATVAFRHYLIAGRSQPPAPSEHASTVLAGGEAEAGGRQLGSPLPCRLLNFVITQPAILRLVPTGDVLDTPFTVAAWLYYTSAELGGSARIENADEAAIVSTEARLLAEIEAEKTAAREAWLAAYSEAEKLAAIRAHDRIVELFPEAKEISSRCAVQPTKH